MKKKEKLFDMFPPVPATAWMEKIIADLKGADFDKKMVWHTDHGFDMKPFFRNEDTVDLKFLDAIPGEFPFIRGKKEHGNSWKIRQNITVKDYTEANLRALDILQKGIDSLGFYIPEPASITSENLKILLKDIVPEAAELNFLPDGRALELAEIFINLLGQKGSDLSQVTGAIEADPLSRLMINGTLCVPVRDGFDYLAAVAGKLVSLPGFRAIHINASNFSNAGADIVRELAFAISMGAEYMSQLTDRGIDPDYAASKIRFSFGTGSDYFPEIAKLRAARILWSAIIHKYQPDLKKIAPMEIHCVTGRWNKTLFDPYVNMLRTQTEAMSAVIGDTDSLTVEPYDTLFRTPDDFSERIARNQQLILKEEAFFDKVSDPSAGSYYIEKLTDTITAKAWEMFVDLEEKGGFLKNLETGFIQRSVKEKSENRKVDTARRKKVFLGTNRYPDPNEKKPSDHDKIVLNSNPAEGIEVEPLRFSRGAEEFESIRLKVAVAVKTPLVFLLTLGHPQMRRARAQFSAEFFGCAGYKIIDNPGFGSVEEGVGAALKSGADIIVICSSDDEYAFYAPEVLRAADGRAVVVVAGNPPCSDELKSTGIENFISFRSDAAATLNHFNELMGIK